MAVLAAALVGALAAPACVPVQSLPLTRSALATTSDLTVEVPAVAASPAFLTQRGGGWSVIATTLVTTNRGGETYALAIDHATLIIADPGGELPEVVLPVTASGAGVAPSALPMNRAPEPLTVSAGTVTRSWVAFRAREGLVEPGLRRRITLRIPVSGGGPALDIVLADPAVERPRWALPAIKHASYGGLSAGGTFDEASIGFVRMSPKSVAGPVVIAPAVELGARAGKLRGEPSSTIACCDLGLSLDLVLPFIRSTWSSLGPTIGYHGIFALESGRSDKAAWHGPSVGITLFSSPIEPRISGALPVRTEPSVLGYSAFSLQYVHWFRRGDDGGSPGFLVTLERSIPEW